MRKKAFTAGIVILGLLGMLTSAANAADVKVDITVTLASTLAINEGVDLAFGSIDPSPLGDTITIDASGGATTTASTLNGSGVPGPTSGDIELISGSDLNVVLTFEPETVVLSSGSLPPLLISKFGENSQGSSTAPFAHSGPSSRINIGGELLIPSTFVPGVYSGFVNVTLNYQ